MNSRSGMLSFSLTAQSCGEPLKLPQPSAGPEAPLEMLAACHGRIEDQCATLRRMVPHLVSKGPDRQARDVAAKLIRYFDTSAKHHHADEEQDLFPALIEAMAGSDAVCIRELTEALKADHLALEAAWRRVRATLVRVAAGEAAQLDAGDVDALCVLYASHISREEAELLPMAARLLSEEELARVGRAMRERREKPG
jgi:hemerythrin-like domain-containing protein